MKISFARISVRLLLVALTAGTLLAAAPALRTSATPTPTAPAATATAPVPTPTASAPTATPPAAGSPFARIIDLVTNINSGDLTSVYAALSPDVQQQFTLAELTEAIQNIEQGTGQIHITVLTVDSTSQTGDQAEIDLTLRIQAGTSVDVMLHDVTSLVLVNGVWRVADHFLQSAFTAIGLVRPGPLQRTFDAQGCVSGDVLAGVYASSRLTVIQPCVTVTGVVHNVDHSLDGDISFNLALPPDKSYLLNDGNRSGQDGMLEVEIVPGDQQRVQTPTEGENVTVTGPWVLDTVHGWNEIHPAWRVDGQQPIDLAALEQALIDAENRGDVAGTMALFTDDVAFSGGVLCQTTPCIGKAAVQHEIQFEVADHFVITRTRVQVIGTTVTGHIEVQGDIITKGGVPRIALDFTDETRGDKISAIHLVFDLSDPQTAQFIRSLAAPAPLAPPSTGTGGPASVSDAWITWIAAGAMALGGVALGFGYFGSSRRVR